MARRRFELVDGDLKRFWEVESEGAAMTTVTGALGTQGRARTKTHHNPAAARAAVGAAIHQMVGLGYQEVIAVAHDGDEDPVLADLIAAVHRERPVAPGDVGPAYLDALQVLADWLVDHGDEDPLVELFAAAMGRRMQAVDWRDEPSLIALQTGIEQERFSWPGMSVTWSDGRPAEVGVHLGLFNAVDAEPEQGRAALHTFLASPLGQILDGVSYTGSLAALDSLLGGARPGLARLTLHDAIGPVRTLAPLVPGLRVLTLRSGAPALGALGLPNLEVLVVETDRLATDQLEGLKYTRLPKLRQLVLTTEEGQLSPAAVNELERLCARCPDLASVVLEGVPAQGLFAGWWRDRTVPPKQVTVRGTELTDGDLDALLAMAEQGTAVCIAPSRYLPGPDPAPRARLKAHPRVTLEAPVTAMGEILEGSDDGFYQGTME